jgi:predicted phosphoadenosine phosphosulfate sulfurtransferase
LSDDDEKVNGVEYKAAQEHKPAKVTKHQEGQITPEAALPSYSSMTVAQLKNELWRHNLPVGLLLQQNGKSQ